MPLLVVVYLLVRVRSVLANIVLFKSSAITLKPLKALHVIAVQTTEHTTLDGNIQHSRNALVDSILFTRAA